MVDDGKGRTKPGLGEMPTLPSSDGSGDVTLPFEPQLPPERDSASLPSGEMAEERRRSEGEGDGTGRGWVELAGTPSREGGSEGLGVGSGGAPPSSPAASLTGRLIDGRYRLSRLIGEGGMGAVYEGVHEAIGSRVAIKTLHPEAASRPEAIERFRREAKAAGTIGHPNIVKIHDIGMTSEGLPYMVMDYVEGQSLADLLHAEAPLEPERAVRIAVQMLEALSAAHEKGIVHRDVKPENVMIVSDESGQETARLLDFGISKFREVSPDQQGLTATGTILGTPLYMAPEQARGETDVDHRIDIYAVGATLYVMLSGRQPFYAPNYNALMVKIISESPRPLADLAPDLDPRLVAVVEKAMAADREQRFASAREMIEALEGKRDISLGLRPAREAPSGRGRLWAVAGVTLAVLAVGALSVWAVTGDRGEGSDRGGESGSVASLAGGASHRPEPQHPGDETAAPSDRHVAASSADSQPESDAAARTDGAEDRHRTVHLHVETIPPTATIRLNGRRVANPLDEDLPRSEALTALIEVSAPGYRSEELTVPLTEDVRRTVRLRRARGRRPVERSHRIEAKATWEPPPP